MRAAGLAALLAVAVGPAVRAQAVDRGGETGADDWTRQKCDLYRSAWQRLIDTQGTQGASDDFLLSHQRFIDAGCDHDIRVCARTEADIELANLLTILSMNEGMASTFVPFGCPD